MSGMALCPDTYFVLKDDPEAEGMAMTYFMVNKSPGKGACSVQPSSGVEMDTVFRVFCKEWQDEQLPVWYEVSYSLSDDEAARSRSASGPSVGDRQLVYWGLSHQVAFRLPAGLPQYGRKVFLRLSIRDSWGASTSVCHIPIAVAPHSAIAHHHDNTTGTHADDNRQSLDHEVQALLRHLQTSVYRGDVTGVVDSNEVFTHLAMRLNSLVSTTAHSSNTTTNDTADDIPALAEIRFGLLQAIRHMPLRDEVEVEKSLRCLLHATRTVSQIDGPCFVLGVQLLEKISRQSGVAMSEWRHSVERDVVGLVVQVVSNLLQAATHSPLMLDVENIDHKRFHWMQRALDVVQRVITLALYDHTLGEVPLSHHTDFVTVTASHYPAHWPSSINISHTSFHLPAHISSFTKRPALNDSADGVDGLTADMRTSADEDDLGDCYQARVTSFQRNPFVYRKETLKENIDVQSEVVSLDVFSCDGEQHLLVDQLKPDINVEFVIPLKSSVESTWEHELSRSHMSIHQFNMTESQENLYLTLLVNLVPIPASSQPFPITAIISEHWPPRPQHSIFRQDFQKEQNELRIFISPGSLNGAGTYNLGLVETSLNSGRRHKTEVVQRQYALSAWFGSCVFWNTSRAVWSDQGCRVSPRTTATVAHCRCDHLTAFGSHFELVPNDLICTRTQW
ncbi:polycystin-1-like protein 1 [Littorina saxatilis]|uniref:polycystin-1-like protein 1 n=1 Tax=Littorina saxatilis TaxID=31220 RepID=UPI0038B4B28C